MNRVTKMWGCRLVVAFVALFSGLHGNSWAGTNDIAATIGLLQKKGLHGFVEAINTKANQLPPEAILSNRSCENIQDAEERQRAQMRRDLGLALLKAMASLKKSEPKARLSDVDDILAIRSWTLSKPSYGNLILNYVAEDSAVTLLLRLLAEPKSDMAEIRLRVNRCLQDSPSSAYWLSVLDQEKDSVQVQTQKGKESADYLQLASIIEALDKKKAAERGGGEWFGFGGGYEDCYGNYNPAQVGWLLVGPAMSKIALEACLVMREKLGYIPTEKEDFRSAAKKYASPIMKREDRIGGRIDSWGVWNQWREAVGK